jgi:hypothetical protein
MQSIHDVMAAERALAELGLESDLVPVPRALSSDCGMAVEFPCGMIDTVRAICRQRSLRLEEIYRKKRGGGYEPCGRAASGRMKERSEEER